MSNQTNGSAAVRSMTGFAQVRRQTDSGEFSVSLRSVNHRGLDLHFHLGTEFLQFESAMRAMLKERIGRGHVEIRTSFCSLCGANSIGFNSDLLKSYVAAFALPPPNCNSDSKPDLNVLLTMPGVTGNGNGEAKLLDATFPADSCSMPSSECINASNAVREREGNELRKALLAELAQIEQPATKLPPFVSKPRLYARRPS